ncbi:hypothetical protein ACUXOR_000613 [Staphylococcus pasteuri]|uniref:DUF3169 family protein n=5 Tax=Staphylococcus TaxID=1279 RepID=A0ABY1H5K8_9STAP|nr:MULTISPECIES: hypothetical protein [Staphylococcus]KKI56272.1 hypothetical protein UF70_1834 [Staphylococcus pasteuri]MDO6574850.1 hypothetical protein [Staphylococcus pasteuri_A]QQT12087.1 hypothetical protein I6J09_05155 [Staphylococcus pasteuri]SFZ75004.1 hypothetical protein SAMN03097721_01046 [Staphylococcus pasteuri]
MFDIQREYLSPYLIGSLLILIVTVCKLSLNKETTDTTIIYVNNKNEKNYLNRKARKKHIIFFIVLMIYLIVINNVIIPLVVSSEVMVNSWSSLGLLIPIIMMILMKDSRIQISDTPTVSAKEKINTQERSLNMLPNYNFSDEYERRRIVNAYASNTIWQLIALMVVSIVDIVIEVIMGHWPISSYISILFIVIISLVITFKYKSIKN